METSFYIRDFFKDTSPENIFIYTDNLHFTYSETVTKAAEYKEFISGFNLTGKRAAILTANCPEFIFLLLALWDLNVIPILINARLTNQEVDNIIKDSECSHLFASNNLTADLSIPITYLPIKTNRAGEIKREIQFNETAVVIFTSGSSGKPKGAELSFKTLSGAAEIQNKYLNQKQGDKWLASLPFYHIGGFSIITRALFGKGSIIICNSLHLPELSDSMKKFKPEYLSLVGTQLKKMIDMDINPGAQVKNILIGGGFTDEDIILNALNKGWKISRTYGSTETSAFIAAVTHDNLRKYPSSSGKELVPGSIFILSENKNPVQPGTEGEVSLKNIPLMTKYLNDESGSAEKFHNGYFLTGDIGYINEDGFLFIHMRRTDLIISGGENIDPKEVERVLLGINDIKDVHVFPIEDKEWGQSAAAVICSSTRYNPEELKNLLSGKLAGYKIPRRFYFVREIPRSELGKVQLSTLKKSLGLENF